jgi:glycosyltransferase involved in cell wall biosynthesis
VIFYLTFNDAPSGIYKSQVIDVASLMETLSGETVKVVAFVSARNFKEHKAWILKNRPGSWVAPMFPGIDHWNKNQRVLRWMLRHDSRPKIVARGPLACALALNAFEHARIVYDGRGAIAAEHEEYDVFGSSETGKTIGVIEKQAVMTSFSRIAVSNALVQYWNDSFGYTAQRHTIIPCSLSDHFTRPIQDKGLRSAWNFNDTQVVLAFSGSLSGWHSFDSLKGVLKDALNQQEALAVVFFSQPHAAIEELMQAYPGRVRREWLNHNDVPAALMACDYGLLIRDRNTTNRVSSPVKFAEYLACGLPVIISPEIGDFTSFVEENDCGEVLLDVFPILTRPTSNRKEAIRKLALLHFSKYSIGIRTAYRKVVDQLRIIQE